MSTNQQAHIPVTDLEWHARFLADGRDTAGVVAAVRAYLAAWPAERVARLQQVDGGWGPFDARQQPTPMDRAEDVRRAYKAVEQQCAALRDAGVAPGPELLALDQYLFLACAKLAQLGPDARAAVRAPAPAGAMAATGARDGVGHAG